MTRLLHLAIFTLGMSLFGTGVFLIGSGEASPAPAMPLASSTSTAAPDQALHGDEPLGALRKSAQEPQSTTTTTTAPTPPRVEIGTAVSIVRTTTTQPATTTHRSAPAHL
jgi:hypothetical protein